MLRRCHGQVVRGKTPVPWFRGSGFGFGGRDAS